MKVGDEILLKAEIVDVDSNPHGTAIAVFIGLDNGIKCDSVRFWIHRLDQEKVIHTPPLDKNEKDEKKPLESPSDQFQEAFIDSSVADAECSFCGRHHFAPHSDFDTDEDYMSMLEDNADKEPDKYIRNIDSGEIRVGYIEGKPFVYGCPCNALRKYEDWLLRHQHEIFDYFHAALIDKQYDVNTLNDHINMLVKDAVPFTAVEEKKKEIQELEETEKEARASLKRLTTEVEHLLNSIKSTDGEE